MEGKNVTVYAAPKVLQDMMAKVLDVSIAAAIDVKPVDPGTEAAPAVLPKNTPEVPLDSTRKMYPMRAGRYKDGTNVFTVAEGSVGLGWFTGGAWEVKTQALPVVESENNLVSTSTTKPLAANQGRVLDLKSGKYTSLSPIATQNDKLIRASTGVFEDVAPYSISEFSIKLNRGLFVYANLRFQIASTYSIIAFYNGDTYLGSPLVGEGDPVTRIDKYVETYPTANRMFVAHHKDELPSLMVFESMPLIKYDKPIADGSIQSVKISDSAKRELVGSYSVLSPSTTIPNVLMKPNGVLEATTFGYRVLVFNVIPSSIATVRINLTFAVNVGFVTIAQWVGESWLKDTYRSVTGQTVYEATIELEPNVNRLYVMAGNGQNDSTLVVQRPLIFNKDFIDGSVTVQKLSERARLELVVGYEVLTPSATRIGKIMTATGGIQDNGTYRILEYDVTPGKVVKYHDDVRFAVNAAFVASAFYNGDTFVDNIERGVPGKRYFDKVANVPMGANKLFLLTHADTASNLIVTQSENVYTSLLNQVPVDVLLPPNTYGFVYNSATVNFINRLYIEGIIRANLPGAKINGEDSIITDSVVTTSGTSPMPVTISAPNLSSVTRSFNHTRTLISNANNKVLLTHKIGDSLTDIGWSALCEFIAKAFKEDLSLGTFRFLSVGSRRADLEITALGKTIQARGCHDGTGGWAISDYLRHVMTTRARYGSNSSTMLVGKVAWDSLGLGTMTREGVPGRAYQTYTWSESSGNLIRATCHGWYDADPTPELWGWIGNNRSMAGQSFTHNGTTYTFGSSYSTADDAAQIAYIKFICQSPINKFFDFAVVQSSNGSHAFSYSTFQNRYKTLDQNGNRLVVGSTAGTRVTDVNSYDVCIPTHVTIIMNQNDENQVSSAASGVLVAEDHILMANLINAEYPSIKIALGATRKYGALNPSSYNHLGFVNTFPFTTLHYSVNDKLLSDTPAPYTYLPVYSVGSPIGVNGGSALDTLNNQRAIRYNGDQIHGGNVYAYWDRAYLVTAWEWSTL